MSNDYAHLVQQLDDVINRIGSVNGIDPDIESDLLDAQATLERAINKAEDRV